MRIYSILGIKIIGPWPIDPLVICHAKIISNWIHKGKESLGRRKVRHFCITTTSQIIGAAAAAPAALLSTPLVVTYKHCTREPTMSSHDVENALLVKADKNNK